MIHETVLFEPLARLPVDQHLEYQKIKTGNIVLQSTLTSRMPGYTPKIGKILPNGDSIILDDFNAHDQLWFSPSQDTRGYKIVVNLEYSTATRNLDSQQQTNNPPSQIYHWPPSPNSLTRHGRH